MSRGTGPTLADRRRAGTEESPDRSPRHCWVIDVRYPEKLPGLLLRWEQRADGVWWALVVMATPERDGMLQGWVPASHLAPT